jgi:hypothetical protein
MQQAVFTQVNNAKDFADESPQGSYCACCTSAPGGVRRILDNKPMFAPKETAPEKFGKDPATWGPPAAGAQDDNNKNASSPSSKFKMPSTRTVLMFALMAAAAYFVYQYFTREKGDAIASATFPTIPYVPAPLPSNAMNTMVGAATNNMSLGVSNLFQDV